MTQSRLFSSLALVAIATLAVWSGLVADDEKPERVDEQVELLAQESEKKEQDEKDLTHFMRLKLEASGKVLEGLATEDYDLIRDGAKELNEMSNAEKWRVSNDALYRNFSGDFQRLTKDLEQAAKDENLDRAALKWMDATLSCIECHRYARGILIASNDFPEEIVR